MFAVTKAGALIESPEATPSSVRPILDGERRVGEATTSSDSPRGANAALENVTVSFDGSEQVLTDVSLSVTPGECVCLVGPSGGGKSTILNLLAGLVKPTKGRVLFDGVEVTSPSPERAMVFQDAALFPWLTLEQNIGFPLEVAGMPKKERAERVESLLRLVHLLRFRNAYPHELSGGMRQRGALARALGTKPRLMLFDEPFAALDGQMRELLQAEVERITRATRMTTIFVTHQIDEAVRLGDRVVLVGTRPGRIIGEVPIDIARPRQSGDVSAVRVARRIAEAIREEVEKVAREEADGAWGKTPERCEDPSRHLGRGI